MNQRKIFYYISSNGENPVSEFLDSLTEQQQVKILRIFQTIKTYGLSSILPHLKKLIGTPLWEIRVLGKDNIRIIYLIADEKAIVLLHGFIKKTQKTASKDLSLAINRYKAWKIRNPK